MFGRLVVGWLVRGGVGMCVLPCARARRPCAITWNLMCCLIDVHPIDIHMKRNVHSIRGHAWFLFLLHGVECCNFM